MDELRDQDVLFILMRKMVWLRSIAVPSRLEKRAPARPCYFEGSYVFNVRVLGQIRIIPPRLVYSTMNERC